jgi:hypothetical protein
MTADYDARREARKHGTDVPHHPTDEFVVYAFAEGAQSLWPDGRDPGWHVTFRRWLEQRDREVRERVIDGMTVPPGGPDDPFWQGAQWAYGQVREALDTRPIPSVVTGDPS